MARRMRASVVAVTVLGDLVMVVFSYGIARAVWPARHAPDLQELARVSPVILATIPCWLIVFLVVGLYRPSRILEGLRAWMPAVLGAIAVSVFAVIVVAFVTKDDNLHRAWIVALWIVATVLVVAGRIVTGEVARQVARPTPSS